MEAEGVLLREVAFDEHVMDQELLEELVGLVLGKECLHVQLDLFLGKHLVHVLDSVLVELRLNLDELPHEVSGVLLLSHESLPV